MWGRMVTDDFQFSKGDGTIFPKGRESWEGVMDAYKFFNKVSIIRDHISYPLMSYIRFTTSHTSWLSGRRKTVLAGNLVAMPTYWQMLSVSQIAVQHTRTKGSHGRSRSLLDFISATRRQMVALN